MLNVEAASREWLEDVAKSYESKLGVRPVSTTGVQVYLTLDKRETPGFLFVSREMLAAKLDGLGLPGIAASLRSSDETERLDYPDSTFRWSGSSFWVKLTSEQRTALGFEEKGKRMP